MTLRPNNCSCIYRAGYTVLCHSLLVRRVQTDTMGPLPTCAVVLAFVCFASCEQVLVRGALHDAMVETLQSHPTIRKVTVADPELRASRSYLPKKPGQKRTSRRKSCRWTMSAIAVGDYDVDKGFAYMTPDDCAKYSDEDWADVFPCVFDKRTLTTTCNGQLPEGADQERWHVGYLSLEPKNRHAPLKPAPVTRPVSATPFKAEPTLIGLGGLGLAKAAQCTGVYSGSTVIRMGWYDGNVHVKGQSPELEFDANVELDNAFPYAVNGPQEMSVAWYAWQQDGDLILDMVHEDVDAVAVAAAASAWGADQGAATPTPLKRLTVRYSTQDLAAHQVTIDGVAYSYRFTEDGKTLAAEPRMCPVLTLSATCGILRGLTAADNQRLGNITGFYLTSSTRNADGDMTIAGNVLGTRGLLNVNYRGAVVNPADRDWIELPIHGLSQCAQRVYAVEECVGDLPSSPQIGPLVYDRSYDLEGVLHDILPAFTAF